MKSLIITVAGTATRFNRDTQEPTLKCLYNVGGFQYSLLSQILDRAKDYDEFVIVGGYLFDKLQHTLDTELPQEMLEKVKLVYNPNYSIYGSGYSLLMGLHSVSPEAREILFVEGDLYLDRKSFDKVKKSVYNVFTVNHEIITARKAVVVYEASNGGLHYLYDTTHSYLRIPEPFLAVYNSGQVWKFVDIARINQVIDNLTPEQAQGTNLEIIQEYFGGLTRDQYEMVEFKIWHNCNTIEDYNIVRSKI